MNSNPVLYEGRIPTEAGSARHVSEQASSPVSYEDADTDGFSYVVLPAWAYACGDLEGLVIEAKPRETGLPDLISNTEMRGE